MQGKVKKKEQNSWNSAKDGRTNKKLNGPATGRKGSGNGKMGRK